MKKYTGEYIGGEYGSPNDYGVRLVWEGCSILGIPPINKIILLCNSQNAADELAKALTKHKAVYVSN
jgi:hypothetical protein